MTIDTAIEPGTVLHRLAFAVECVDAVTDRLVTPTVRIGVELSPHIRPHAVDPGWPCLDLDHAGPGRAKLRYPRPKAAPGLDPAKDRGGLPADLTVRIDDPARRLVPRRFDVHPWLLSDLPDEPSPNYVPVGARTLRAWLAPGSAYPLAPGTTAIRGRVAHAGRPVRWARIEATVSPQDVAGRAHADDRGEFVLVIANTFQNPIRSTVSIQLVASAPAKPVDVDVVDRCADLVAEDVPRSRVPVLDSDLLRGIKIPPGYVRSSTAPLPVSVPVGAELFLTNDVDFVSP